MQVSAVSFNSANTVFNTRANNRILDNYTETSFGFNTPQNITEDRAKLFDSINEWKYFCHSQIEKGHLDIIA